MNPSLILNFAQQVPYGFQPQNQSPNVFTTPTSNTVANPPPPRAVTLIEDVISLLSKTENIEQTVRLKNYSSNFGKFILRHQ